MAVKGLAAVAILLVVAGCAAPDPAPSTTSSAASSPATSPSLTSAPTTSSAAPVPPSGTGPMTAPVAFIADGDQLLRIRSDVPARYLMVANGPLRITGVTMDSTAPTVVFLRPAGAEPGPRCTGFPPGDFWGWGLGGASSEPGSERPAGTYWLEAAAADADGPAPVDVLIQLGNGTTEETVLGASPSGRGAFSLLIQGEVGEEPEFDVPLVLERPSWVFGRFSVVPLALAGNAEITLQLTAAAGSECARETLGGAAAFVGVTGTANTVAQVGTMPIPAGVYRWSGVFTATVNATAGYQSFVVALTSP